MLHASLVIVAEVSEGNLDPEEAVTRFRKCAASRFSLVWTESTHDERLQFRALAGGGVVDARRTAVVSSLVNRGIVEEDRDTGVVSLCSRAFGEFIEYDVDHLELDAWRKEGGGGGWRFIWPPLAIGAALGLAFLAVHLASAGHRRGARAGVPGHGQPGDAGGAADYTGGPSARRATAPARRIGWHDRRRSGLTAAA